MGWFKVDGAQGAHVGVDASPSVAAGPAAPAEAEIDGPANGGRDSPALALLIRLALWAVVLTYVVVADPDEALSLMLIALAGAITIVSDQRLPIERRLDEMGIPTREAWVPLAMLGLMLQLDLVGSENLEDVFTDKGPVILFILAFALVAEGMRGSGFIHFLAYRLTSRGGANTTRLTLYLFLLSSLLAYFTSNDIVVLTMTPIVLSVAYQARVRNAKLLLLSQFVAANTVSMGLLIGSPTNLILGRAMDFHFFEHFFLMLAPSLMALMGTFTFVMWVNRFVARRAETRSRPLRWLVGSWNYSPTYTPPRFSEFRSLTGTMRLWVGVFTASVLMLAIGTATTTGLLIAAVLIAVLALVFVRREARERDERTGARWVVHVVRSLPLGIVFFGMTYFVIADAIADTRFVREDVDEFVTDHSSSHTPIPSWGSILLAGGLVNTMNDLPAAALGGEVVEHAEFETPFDRTLVVQGTLVGLNIGTYVTPVGALAGIIWFDLLHKERRRQRLLDEAGRFGSTGKAFDIVLPRRRDLVIYGTATFLTMTAILGATNFGFVALADALLGPPGGGSEFGSVSSHLLWTVGCAAVIVGVVISFRRVLAAGGVALAHLGDVLVVLTQVRLWASRHRALSAAILAALIFVSSGALLYWAEEFHARHYDRTSQFDDVGEFITWLMVFVSSGFENGEFPRSTLGNLLAALLALGSIAILVVLVRISTGSHDLSLRRRLARGDIPSDRLVIVNCGSENAALVRTLVRNVSRFVTIATRDPGLEHRFDLQQNDRVDVIPYERVSVDLVAELRLDEARELVLLSRSVSDDFDNLALLVRLDAVTSGAAGTPTRPSVVLQLHEPDLPGLFEQRLGSGLRDAMVRPPFEEVTRAFLVADIAGRPADLRRLHTEPLLARRTDDSDDEVEGRVRFRGLGSLYPDGDAAAGGHGPLERVLVVGGGSFAQGCALDLVAAGVRDVGLVVGTAEPLLPGIEASDDITVTRCEGEVGAATAVGADAAALVVDEGEQSAFDSGRLLEQLSLARLHLGDDQHDSPLVVCCRGAARARWMRNFVVDRVVDATRVEASYFAVFSTVYFDVLLEDEELANWPAVRQLRVAHAVASRLCHLDVARHGQLQGDTQGEVRFTIEHDAARPVVAVDVVPMAVTAERPVPRTLQVGLFYV